MNKQEKGEMVVCSSSFFFLLLASSLLLSSTSSSSSHAAGSILKVPNLATLSFEEGYTQLFGDSNLMLHRNGRTVRLSLDQRTGTQMLFFRLCFVRFVSVTSLQPSVSDGGLDCPAFHGVWTMGRCWIRLARPLPPWILQCFHQAPFGLRRRGRRRVLCKHSSFALFYIDNTPIREVIRTQATGGQFPSKPMSLYATIWDGSNWATLGGRYKVNYKYAPYIAEFADLILHGCAVDPSDHTQSCQRPDVVLYDATTMSTVQRSAMEKFRKKHMTYSYCHDRVRYPTLLPECEIGPESESFHASGETKLNKHRNRAKRHQWSSAGTALSV
ncbi:hypothetical protein BHM03_00024128 [Ensete ventricosum]|nr:hypothetical protein BHM03_00024128 [Ensete ventricosum]